MIEKFHDGWDTVVKVAIYIIAAMLGIVAKIAIMNTQQKLTKCQMAAKGLSGMVVAWLYGWYCYSRGAYFPMMMGAPIATFFGEHILTYIADNFKTILTTVLKTLNDKK